MWGSLLKNSLSNFQSNAFKNFWRTIRNIFKEPTTYGRISEWVSFTWISEIIRGWKFESIPGGISEAILASFSKIFIFEISGGMSRGMYFWINLWKNFQNIPRRKFQTNPWIIVWKCSLENFRGSFFRNPCRNLWKNVLKVFRKKSRRVTIKFLIAEISDVYLWILMIEFQDSLDDSEGLKSTGSWY